MEAAVPDLDLAMHWAGENGDVDLGLHVSSALWRWWLFSGQLAVGRDWLAKFLTTVGDRDDEVTGRAYCAAAVLAAENGDYREAVRQAELAMAIFGPLGLKTRMTLAATVIGSANRYLGNHEGARRGFERAMELRDELGDRRGMSVAINNLALLELDDGDLHRAQQLFEQALAIKREFGERRSIAIGLANLADVLIRTSQWDAAEAVLTEGADLAAGNPQLVGTIACNQGALAAHRQDWARATERFEAAIASSQAGGHPHDVVEAMIGLGRVHALTGDHQAAVARLRAAHALAAEIGNPQRLAEAEAALAEVAGPASAAGVTPPPAAPAGEPDRPPGRGAGAAGGGPVEQADRGRAVPEHGDGRTPPGHHLPQSRPRRPGGGGQVRDGERARLTAAAHCARRVIARPSQPPHTAGTKRTTVPQ